jgi:hypothetical protein
MRVEHHLLGLSRIGHDEHLAAEPLHAVVDSTISLGLQGLEQPARVRCCALGSYHGVDTGPALGQVIPTNPAGSVRHPSGSSCDPDQADA